MPAWGRVATGLGAAGARAVRVLVACAVQVPRLASASAVLSLAGILVHRPVLGRAALLVWLVPALVVAVVAAVAPGLFDRVIVGPVQRASWRRWVRRSWPDLAAACGLVDRRTPALAADLVKVGARGNLLVLVVRPAAGQCLEDVEAAVPAIAVAANATSHRTRVVESSLVEVSLVMRSILDVHPATLPTTVVTDAVEVGRCDGSPWRVTVRGRHTLVVGCSGAGKGSILWGLVGGLAPAIAAGVVRVWGVDLKRGVELGMGRDLFHTLADHPTAALTVLSELLEVITERGRVMAGTTRLHTPTPGDPLHVLVVDELATLVAYADPDTRREASRLLAEILSQGRALGVVVVACVQDPRKETIGFRGLFTQTVALRLRSAEETRMVLGDGMATKAPAHRISPAVPGTGYVVGDDGTVDLVRANWWPDELVQATAARYPDTAPRPAPLEAVDVERAVPSATAEREVWLAGVAPVVAPRVRSPRTSRRPVSADDPAGGDLP